jgi:hypothetical protein
MRKAARFRILQKFEAVTADSEFVIEPGSHLRPVGHDRQAAVRAEAQFAFLAVSSGQLETV